MTSLKIRCILSALLFLVSLRIEAQQTVTISGSEISDAMVQSGSNSSNNFQSHPRIAAVAWTLTTIDKMRTLMYFDLKRIPPKSYIQSATLYLYSDPTISGANDPNGNSQQSGSNALYLEKITGEWHASTVDWIHQPTATTIGRLSVSASTSAIENRQIDLKTFVQDWVNSP